MKLIPESVTRNIGRKILLTKKNSPHIFFVGGIVGVVTSTVLACKATLKLENNLDQFKADLVFVKDTHSNTSTVVTEESEYSEKEYYKDLSRAYIKGIGRFGRLYGPSIAIGTASIAALTGSHVQLTRRNAALTTTLALVSKAYDDYRIRVQEELGEERELEIYRNLKEIEDEEGTKKQVVSGDPNTWSPYARFFDEVSPNWQKNAELNRIFLQCQQQYANHLLRARGHVFLNEVYDSLGMERSQAGQVVGWVMDGDGDNYVDFGLFEPSSNRFIAGIERSILLDFNVDGVVFDKI